MSPSLCDSAVLSWFDSFDRRARHESVGCRIAIVSPNDNAVSSTAGTLLPPNWVHVVRCSPGQRVSAISNDAGTFSLSITELTD